MLDKVRSKRKNGDHNDEKLILSHSLRSDKKRNALPASLDIWLPVVREGHLKLRLQSL